MSHHDSVIPLTWEKEVYRVLRYPPTAPLELSSAKIFSLTKTDEEVSLILEESEIPLLSPQPEEISDEWSTLKVRGPLDFGLTGILSRIAAPLAEAGVSIFAVSTYDTDYVLIPRDQQEEAHEALGGLPGIGPEEEMDDPMGLFPPKEVFCRALRKRKTLDSMAVMAWQNHEPYPKKATTENWSSVLRRNPR